MKRIIKTIGAAILGVACLSAVSCQEKNPVITPSFPEKVIEKTLSAGQSEEITFEANMNWTLTVEGNGAGVYFGILDDGMLETKKNGSAGSQKVVIGFTEDIEFDTERVCEVKLAMGDEEKMIAKFTRMPGDRTISFYSAVVDEFDFKKDGGNYVYATESSSALEFVTFRGKTTYSLPVKVDANFGWMLNSSSEFVSADIKESNEGTAELMLTLTLDQSIAAGAEVELQFLDKDNTEVKYPVKVTVPAFGNRVEFEEPSSLLFNKAGWLKNNATGSFIDQPAIVYFLAAKGSVVRALEYNSEKGWYETSFASWVSSETNFDENGTLLQSVVAQINVEENEATPREADIFILPASLAGITVDDLCNTEGTAIKDDYKPYLIGRLQQEGETPAFVTILNEESVYKATLVRNAEGTSDLTGVYGTDQIYTLTYTDEYSDCPLQFASAVASYDYYDYNNAKVADPDNFWLEMMLFGENLKGRVYMYPDAFKSTQGEAPESNIVLKDADGKALAVLNCKFLSEGGDNPGESGMVTIGSGVAKVEKLSSGDIYDILSSNLGITEIYSVNASSKSTDLIISESFWNIALYNAEFGSLTDKSFEVEAFSDTKLNVYINEKTEPYTNCFIVLSGENETPFAAIMFTYDPEVKSDKAAVSFAYPDMVQNATLSQYTGSLLGEIMGNTGADPSVVYELRYKGNPTMAIVNVPGIPYREAALGNWDEELGGPSSNYWLTYEMLSDTMMYIDMSETGKTDYFAWIDSEWRVVLVLVCTAEAAE